MNKLTRKLSPVSQYSGRRKLFLGAASEANAIAEAIHILWHEETIQITPWYTKDFRANCTTFSELQRFLREHYFAAFLLTPTDHSRKKGKSLPASRDNVLFELGMFLGHAGPKRTFILQPRGIPMHIPSDLAGLTLIEYEPVELTGGPEDSENLRAAMAPACSKLKEEIIRADAEERRDAVEKMAQRVEGLRESLRNSKSSREHFSIITAGLRRLAEEKSESFHETSAEILEDVLLWSGNLLDVLDTYHLAQSELNTTEVWVYAQEPLELSGDQPELRQTVFENLCAGVRYTYFVDSDGMGLKVMNLVSELAREHSNGRSIRKWEQNISILRLHPRYFLGSFTVHYHSKAKKNFSVFQNVVRKTAAGSRRDYWMKLHEKEAHRVHTIIYSAYREAIPVQDSLRPSPVARAVATKNGDKRRLPIHP